ncbi:MAG: glycerate kinase [Dehalococcoidia bacterium]|nr:glycerate kinase [Dehalococcoidia bacterium]
MRFLISPQEFKGSLSAEEAAQAIARGLRRAWPEAELDVAAMADGGPGTVAAVLSAGGGQAQKTVVSDPLGRPVEAVWALLDDGPAAVIEMAAASGLVLLCPEELDPRRTTTYGTGELIGAALDAGCRRLTVGVGGSATNDGGGGMAQALGARLLDEQERDLPPGGAALARLHRIDPSGLDARLADVRVQVATDVTNPLCGDLGASRVYGPQKGATPEAVEELEAALCRYAEIVRRDLGVDIADAPGAGAAGGLGGGLIAFLKAEVRPGGELVAEAIGLRERMKRADVVLTGEGRLDRQTGFGKTVATVARMAKEEKRPVIALVGGIEEDSAATEDIDAVLSIISRPMTLAEAMTEAAGLLEDAAARAAALARGGYFPRR